MRKKSLSIIGIILAMTFLVACGSSPAVTSEATVETKDEAVEPVETEDTQETESVIEDEADSPQDEEPTETMEENPDVPEEPQYHIPDYWGGYSAEESPVVYYDGSYYLTGSFDEKYGSKLIKYDENTGKEEVLFDNPGSMYLIDDVLYLTVSDEQFGPNRLVAYPLDGREINDHMNPDVSDAGQIMAHSDKYMVYSTYTDEINADEVISTLYGVEPSFTHVITGIDAVLGAYIEDESVYIAWTPNEFDDNPDVFYKKYDIQADNLSDVSADEIPDDFVIYLDTDPNYKDYKEITGSELGLNTVYHDHLIYTTMLLQDKTFVTYIEVYDYEGNKIGDFALEDGYYLGCANDNMIYIEGGELKFFPLD